MNKVERFNKAVQDKETIVIELSKEFPGGLLGSDTSKIQVSLDGEAEWTADEDGISVKPAVKVSHWRDLKTTTEYVIFWNSIFGIVYQSTEKLMR